jgi:hypothetical protein
VVTHARRSIVARTPSCGFALRDIRCPGGKFWGELVRQLERLAPPGLWLAAVAAGIATSSVRQLPDGRRRRYDGPRPYDLSHTFVSLLIQEGRALAYVAEQAGHTFEECVRTYTDLFDEYRDARPVPAEDLIHVLPCKSKPSRRRDSNPRPPLYESGALAN